MTPEIDPLSPLAIRLLGPFDGRVGGKPFPRLRSRKVHGLLALLILRAGRPVERSLLNGLLWPESGEEQAQRSLRTCLHDLRRALGPETWRLQSPARLVLAFEADGADIDLLAFDAAVGRKELASLERAISIYRGPFLEGSLEEWVFAEREIRQQAFVDALEAVARVAIRRNDPSAAIPLLLRAAATAPLRETIHREMMRAYAAAGCYPDVVRTYRSLRSALLQEMRTEPSTETTRLFQRLREAETERDRIDGAPTRTVCPAAPEANGTIRSSIDGPPLPAAPFDRISASSLDRIPHPVTPLIGREREMDEVIGRLLDSRWVTLSGPGGIGKTRLGIGAARRMAGGFPDGAHFIDLAPIVESERVWPALVSLFRLKDTPDRSPADAVLDYLEPKSLLLLFDNCEHLVDACVPLIESILSRCSGARVLATSRRIFERPGEVVYPVPSLTFPTEGPPGADSPPAEALERFESIRLFAERAKATSPSFVLNGENAETVVRICRRLEGIPLAIEMAAARTSAMSPVEVLDRLYDRLLDPVGTRDGTAARGKTLRTAMDWSYRLLPEGERFLLHALSVFAGGFTRKEVEKTGARLNWERRFRTGAPEILEGITSLVHRSFLRRIDDGRGTVRFGMLEPIREYAGERLVESGEAERVRREHAKVYLGMAEEMDGWIRGTRQMDALERLAIEAPNLEAALVWASGPAGDAEVGHRLACALYAFWLVRGQFRTGWFHCERVLLGSPEGVAPLWRAGAMTAAASMVSILDDFDRCRSLAVGSLRLTRRAGESVWTVLAHNSLGFADRNDRRYLAARRRFEKGAEVARRIGDEWGLSLSIFNQSVVAVAMGEDDRAIEMLEANRKRTEERGDLWSLSFTLNLLPRAILRTGDTGRSVRLHRENMAVFRRLGNEWGVATCLEGMAEAAAEGGRVEAAARLFGAEEALRERTGSPLWPTIRRERDRRVRETKERLGEAAYERATAEGRGMSPESAVDAAFPTTGGALLSGSAGTAGLSNSTGEGG